MAWWHRSKRATGRGDASSKKSGDAVRKHFADFIATRRGVEAYVEPPTNVTSTTVILIAHDGEWTRRAVPDVPTGAALARGLGIPVYDINQTGYPASMRNWNARQRRGPASSDDPGA